MGTRPSLPRRYPLIRRYWKQGTTGAWFLAASVEKNVFDHHSIEDNGYNRGRNEIVGKALANPT